jgi:FemAB-related protein (PEP-CTERM system-associated)
MLVREIQAGEEGRWDEYVCGSQYSAPLHLFAWKKVMQEVFHSEAHYLLAEDNGTIMGILPLIHIKSLLAGDYVTSLPGGMCADNNEAADLLLAHAKSFVKAHNASYLILRDGRHKWALPELVTDEEHVTFVVEIPSNLDQLKRAMKKRTRQLITKVSNNGVYGMVGLDKLDEYYPVYAKAMQDLGTPTMGAGFFKCMSAHFLGKVDLITLSLGNEIVGGGFISTLNNIVYCLWSGLLQDYYGLHTSYLLSWEAIKYTHQNGYQWLDLGRCRKASGGYNFKKNFGGQAKQIYQQFYLNGISQPPRVGGERSEDMTYRAFVSIWRRLPPPATEALGPLIRKQLPFG